MTVLSKGESNEEEMGKTHTDMHIDTHLALSLGPESGLALRAHWRFIRNSRQTLQSGHGKLYSVPFLVLGFWGLRELGKHASLLFQHLFAML